MKRALRTIAATTLSMTLLAGGAVWQLAFRTPAEDLAPLPDRLVALTSPAGARLLADAVPADYEPLLRTFESQQRPAYCGVASSVTVLNALRPPDRPLRQGEFFPAWTSQLRVTFTGMTLHELGGHLRRQGALAEVVYATDTTLDAFRRTARQNLARQGDFILVNYQRAALGQREGGHISPLAAYSAQSDRFLVLDVARYRYPPVWVSAGDLWAAMNAIDDTSGRSRGFVVVAWPGVLPP